MSNVLFVLWMGFSAGLLLLFFYAAYLNMRNRNTRNVDLGEMIPSFLPVNAEPLADLIEDGPSQLNESEDEIRRVQLTIDCLRRMAHNAALLQRVGYSQLHSPNQLICDLAQEMIDAGVHVRLYSFIGLAVLHTWVRFRFVVGPLSRVARAADLQELLSSSLVPAYEQLKTKAGNLTCLKFSSLSEELAQSL
ncbi:MAG TPA: hypothetical protein VKW06_10890 [Candidatus Angelobacter sp.]|nr:hypothetical protein [Candidatus Angelobacter sp.]